jgi:acyl-CoA reductase-like NAD-dependent aldehyde dehydrogenase
VLEEVASSDAGDVDAAVAAAAGAFDEWARTTPRARSELLHKVADAIAADLDTIQTLEIDNVGKPESIIEFEMDLTLDNWRFFAAGARFLEGRAAGEYMEDHTSFLRRDPIGVVASIAPWNYPINMATWKVGPALAAGNTVVLKPSELTPLSAIRLAEITAEILPPGVLNVVTGDIAASERLTTHPGVDMVSFTGSDAVGKQIMGQAAQGLKKVLLELGGKSPNIVFEGSDVAKFSFGAAFGFTIHAGQGCALPTRILAQRSIYDEVVERMAASLAKITVGDPTDAKTGMGPLIREAQRDRVERYVASGQEEGARVACGGSRPAGLDRGYFYEPTLLADVKSSMSVAQDEIFGPVGVAIPFDDEDDAVRIANDTRYGLAASVWHPDAVKAYELAQRIDAGTVSINGGGGGPHLWGPFGGFKQSGIGREFGDYGLLEYTQLKTVSWPAGRP